MATKNSNQLQKAIENLVIEDVYQKNSRSFCADDFDTKSYSEMEHLHIQQMHVVHKSETIQVEDDGELLRVFVRLGTRWVVLSDDESEPNIKAAIESDFIAEYRINAHLEQECIDEFSLKNASYHVWPYWREYLSSQCERMRLPRVVLPTVQFTK
ncbi:preprotein translocase subunit SecB [Shewanella aestuarii]|uniref:Preprotein translocase subunit SecB n=1 Tax=Shewanella aestuarii TaxID=1028752 RepID=A0A6G9QR09_9GAMM|nr:preprotein translocase subunit SecB [Shewanella aestuarii]QIR16477.1 preprotein translocase subunit SecB [Shewanella aestuarii]